MIELKGKYNSAKVFTDNIDNETVGQLITLLNQEFTKDNTIRIMPDTHAGKGCVIGTTMTINNKIVPNLVGVDIGCGMLAIKLKEKEIDYKKLDEVITKYVPSGCNVHKEVKNTYSELEDIIAPINIDNANKSIGTLGGGNHFIEVDKDKDNNLWLVIHTGSRHLGIEICDYYQNLAYERLKEKNIGGNFKDLSKRLITEYKKAGKEKEISKALQILKNKFDNTMPSVSKELAYLEGQDMKDYLHDMKIAQEYAKRNRCAIASEIIEHMNLTIAHSFNTTHNYIDLKVMILRKGAISALKGEEVIIPMNMRDGSLICIGKGNPDWNYSAPHGAGRILSRSKAKDVINLKDFEDSMKGIYTTSVALSTIDESPFVYKPMDEIIENIKDTVEIVNIIKPVYNFKAKDMHLEGVKKEHVLKQITGELDGEDKMQLCKAVKQSDGTYKTSVKISDHKNDRGEYLIHLYYVIDSGKQIGVGGTTTTVESASTTSNPSKPSIPNSGVYTFKGHASIKAEPKISAPELAYPDVGH